METFGLLKILQSALSSAGQTFDSPQETERKTCEPSPLPIEKEGENAFVQLMMKHERLSKNIDRKQGK